MQGLMMNTPLLITSIMRHAERVNGKVEVISVTAENPRHGRPRYIFTPGDVVIRQLRNTNPNG